MKPNIFSSEPQLKSHHDVLELLERRYEEGLRNGTHSPTIYPSFTYGLVLLILFFMIPPTSRFHNVFTRYITFGVTAAWHVWIIFNCKAFSPSVSFGIGLISAWGILWTAAVLVFNDAKSDWKRVKREEVWVEKNFAKHGDQQSADQALQHNGTVKQRKTASSGPTTIDARIQQPVPIDSKNRIEEHRVTYRWQPYPSQSFKERFEWACDLLTTMRGVGWQSKISGLPSRPPLVEASLKADDYDGQPIVDKRKSRNGIRRFDTYWALLIHNYWLIMKGYIAIDTIKTIMSHDPYFWGLLDQPPPAWLPHVIKASWVLTRSYRLIVSMGVVWIGLRTIYCFGPMFFVGVLGPDYLGANGEPWMYPDHYGTYSNVFDRGLAGWWGGWWHQVFRLGFQSGGQWVTDKVLRLKPKSLPSTTIQLFVAFALSGMLHAAGSVTMLGDSWPSRPFLFFALQPLGILGETACTNLLRKVGVAQRLPRWLAGSFRFLWVHVWFFATAPLLLDDFARGGIWHFEPVMLSPLRGLGFGAEGDGFFCWKGTRAVWHSDSRWWLTGIAT